MSGRRLSECASNVKKLLVPLGRERSNGDDARADGFGQSSRGASGMLFLHKYYFDAGGASLVNELLQMFGRRFFAVVLHGELVQAEIAREIAERGMIDDKGAFVFAIEEGANGHFERIDVAEQAVAAFDEEGGVCRIDLAEGLADVVCDLPAGTDGSPYVQVDAAVLFFVFVIAIFHECDAV